eukprot:4783739-Alexandrium_andersonii.AAC.1
MPWWHERPQAGQEQARNLLEDAAPPMESTLTHRQPTQRPRQPPEPHRATSSHIPSHMPGRTPEPHRATSRATSQGDPTHPSHIEPHRATSRATLGKAGEGT